MNDRSALLAGTLRSFQMLNAIFKDLPEEIRYTLRRLDGGNHKQFRVHICKVDVIAGAAYQLRQKNTLCSAVPLAEGMENVGGAIEINDFFDKSIMRQTFEKIVFPEPHEDQ